MKPNVGGLDRVLRIIVGLVLLALGIFIIKPIGLTIAAIGLGAILFLTGLFRFCALYPLFKINTHRVKVSE
jgi:thiol:disulfide interchange protein